MSQLSRCVLPFQKCHLNRSWQRQKHTGTHTPKLTENISLSSEFNNESTHPSMFGSQLFWITPSPVWRGCPPHPPGGLGGGVCVRNGDCCLCWCVLTQLCPPHCPHWGSGHCLTAETGRHLRVNRQTWWWESQHTTFSIRPLNLHLVWSDPTLLFVLVLLFYLNFKCFLEFSWILKQIEEFLV